MATYSRIPASEEPLVAKPQGRSVKALVAGAAVVSFLLGALAATAIASPAAPVGAPAVAALYNHEAKIRMELFPNRCVAVKGPIKAGSALEIENCKDTHRQAFIAESKSMDLRLMGTDLCVALLHPWSDTVLGGGDLDLFPFFGLESCEIDSSRKLTFKDLNKEGQAIELILPGKYEWPSLDKDGNIEKSEKKLCMIPEINPGKACHPPYHHSKECLKEVGASMDLAEKNFEKALINAELMAGPCAVNDEDNSIISWFVDNKKHKPTAPDWDTCDWIESNSNTKHEEYLGPVYSPQDCIDLVKKLVPKATIANIDDKGSGGCWAQFGSNPTPDNAGYKSCVLP